LARERRVTANNLGPEGLGALRSEVVVGWVFT
jgi:hypothetical protein